MAAGRQGVVHTNTPGSIVQVQLYGTWPPGSVPGAVLVVWSDPDRRFQYASCIPHVCTCMPCADAVPGGQGPAHICGMRICGDILLDVAGRARASVVHRGQDWGGWGDLLWCRVTVCTVNAVGARTAHPPHCSSLTCVHTQGCLVGGSVRVRQGGRAPCRSAPARKAATGKPVHPPFVLGGGRPGGHTLPHPLPSPCSSPQSSVSVRQGGAREPEASTHRSPVSQQLTRAFSLHPTSTQGLVPSAAAARPEWRSARPPPSNSRPGDWISSSLPRPSAGSSSRAWLAAQLGARRWPRRARLPRPGEAPRGFWRRPRACLPPCRCLLLLPMARPQFTAFTPKPG